MTKSEEAENESAPNSGAAPFGRPGAELKLKLRSIQADGDGEGELEGHHIVVPGAFPGESVRVRVEARSQHHPRLFTKLLEVEAPHSDRREAACPHHTSRQGHCTGCPLLALGETAQRQAKAQYVQSQFGLVIDRWEFGDQTLAYRWSSKRVASRKRGRFVLGSYRRGSHEIAEMQDCQTDHPLIRAAAVEIETIATEQAVEPYSQKSGFGQLRFVWFKTNGNQVLVNLVAAPKGVTEVEALGRALKQPESVFLSLQGGGGNDQRGRGARRLRGIASLNLEMLGESRNIGPQGFLQPNPEVAEMAYRDLLAAEDGSELSGLLALDLFAGTGITTLQLRKRFESVLACDTQPAAVDGSEDAGVRQQSAEDMLARLVDRRTAPQLVVANPPRAGLGEDVTEALNILRPGRIHIMSCHPKSLSADIERLSQAYELKSLRAYDTLPQTAHLELVAWLVKR